MFVLFSQVLGEETEVAAAKDLCGFSDGGAIIFLSEIGVNQVDSACVAFVVVELGLALLVECGFESRINLAFVCDVKPVVELFHGFTGVFEGGKVVVARGLSDDCPGVR